VFANREATGRRLRSALPFVLIPPLFYLPALTSNLLTEGTPWPGTFQGRVMLLAQNFTLFDPARLPEHLSRWAIFLRNWFLGISSQNVLPDFWSVPIDLLSIFLPLLVLGWLGIALSLRTDKGAKVIWVFLCWTMLTVLIIGCILPVVIYAGRYEAMLVPLIILGIAFAVGWIIKFLSTRLGKIKYIVVSIVLLLMLCIWQISNTLAWLQIRILSVNHIANVHVNAGYFCHILPADKTIAVFDVGAIKFLNPQREILDWAGLTDAAMRRAIRQGMGAEYLRGRNVGYMAVMEEWNHEVYHYPFDLVEELKAGRLHITYDFPSETGMQPLPSFATPLMEYQLFHQAVYIAADRMSFYRVVW